MSPSSDREAAIFNSARGLAPQERGFYLEGACRGDAALRQRVEELLQTDGAAVGFLQELATNSQDSTRPVAPLNPGATLEISFAQPEKPGDRIGRYKLLQQIGEGGCGVVYMAEQEEPVRRRVALKVIKLGMDTKSVIARFEAERQALALMDHPNIAKVLDAGATETGRPYFVMELVKGIPVTRFCDENNLNTQTRLGLFVQICQAIQHAHQKGIIHRDIKPSNILVTDHDGVPVPKIIDFGIAKATTDQRLTDKTLFTAFEQFIGTPAYMSPEQAKMSGLDIDTRSDIYSLGVLLYELLTGKTPFDSKALLQLGLDEMRRTIREQEPVRPSTRLSTMLEGELSTAARHRQLDAPKLLTLLRGDLDWIVMKALEKDRSRRYETANGLAMDIQRHLNNEPVVARPPSNVYRLQKMVRRNKLIFAAASAVALALLLGLVISTWMFTRERNAFKRAVDAGQQARTAQAREADARIEAEKHLYDSLVGEAHATTLARHVGYRDQVFALLRRAKGLNVPQRDLSELRREAVACLGDFVGLTPKSFADFPANATIAQFCLHPSGKIVAFVLNDRRVLLKEMPSGTEVAVLENEYPLWSLCFNDAGDQLVSVQVPDVPNNSLSLALAESRVCVSVRRTDGRWGPPQKLPFPGAFACLVLGTSVVIAVVEPDLHSAKLVDLSSRALVQHFQLPEGGDKQIALTSDSRWMALEGRTGSHQETAVIEVVDLKSGEVVKKLPRDSGRPYDLCFSPAGKWLACLWGSGGAVYSVPGFERTCVFQGHFQAPSHVSFGAEDTLACVPFMEQNRVRLFNPENGQDMAVLEEPGGLLDAAFALDGNFLMTCSSHAARLYTLDDAAAERLSLRGHSSSVPGISFSPDGTRIASVGKDRALIVWDALTGKTVWQANDLPGEGQCVAYSPDGQLLATGDYDTGLTWIWDAQAGNRLLELGTNSPGQTLSVAFSPGGRDFAVAGNIGVTVWTIDQESSRHSGGPLKAGLSASLPGHFSSLVFAPDSRRIAFTGSDSTQLYVWEFGTTVPPRLLGNRSGMWVEVAAFAHGGERLIHMGDERKIVTVEVSTGKQISSFPTLEARRAQNEGLSSESQLSLSPDGSKLAMVSATGRSVDIWAPETGQLMYSLPEQSGTVYWLAWSPDGRRLGVSRSDGDITIWSLEEVEGILRQLNLSP